VEYGALLVEFWALFVEFKARLSECRVLLVERIHMALTNESYHTYGVMDESWHTYLWGPCGSIAEVD